MRNSTKIFVFVYLLLAYIFPHNLYANGFRILGIKGTKATGMGEAYSASR
jgi:hypothetical protein